MVSVLTGVKLQLVPLRQNVHETELNLDLVRAFTGKKITNAPASFVEFLADDERLEHQLPLNQRYICLQLSASNGQPTPKVWPLDRFVDLALRLLDFDPEMNIVLLGDSRDLERVGENELLSNPRIFNLLGRTSLFSLAEIVKNARCVVVHDSGIMHLADALKTPLIALYGPTDHTRTRPLGVNSTVIFSDHESRGIMARVELSEPELAELYPDHVCMSDITIDNVFNAIQSKRVKADG